MNNTNSVNLQNSQSTIFHGGDIASAAKYFNIPANEWLDLSTGLNPEHYPIPAVDDSSFVHLPYLRQDFLQIARNYYHSENIMPMAGSQQVIQNLPNILPVQQALLPQYGYQEHYHGWQKTTNNIAFYHAFDNELAHQQIEAAISANPKQNIVIINPNNPTGLLFPPKQIKQWAEQLDNDCYIIVDEAFMDLTPEHSILNNGYCENIIVLRSFGKFFGLAGIRLGFVVACEKIRRALQPCIGLWSINGPAQQIASKAMQDTVWQENARQLIKQNALLTQQLLAPLNNKQNSSWQTNNGLFLSYKFRPEVAKLIYHRFAQNGILVRLVTLDSQHHLIRFGIISSQDRLAQMRVANVVRTLIT